jgi:hypothetical protein
LTGEILNAIANNCQELEELISGESTINIADLNELGKLRKLKYLLVNQFGGLDHQLRGSLESLTHLTVYKLDGGSVELLKNLKEFLPNLKVMEILEFNQELTDQIRAIFKLDKLEFGESFVIEF